MMDYYILTEDGSSNPPVVAENVGPFESLEDALANWPGFHEATGEEYDAYVTYWDAWYARGTGC